MTPLIAAAFAAVPPAEWGDGAPLLGGLAAQALRRLAPEPVTRVRPHRPLLSVPERRAEADARAAAMEADRAAGLPWAEVARRHGYVSVRAAQNAVYSRRKTGDTPCPSD